MNRTGTRQRHPDRDQTVTSGPGPGSDIRAGTRQRHPDREQTETAAE